MTGANAEDVAKELAIYRAHKAVPIVVTSEGETYPAALATISVPAVNPQLVMVSMPGFGATGPERDYIGYGMTIEATSGMTALTGYEDGPPQMLRSAVAPRDRSARSRSGLPRVTSVRRSPASGPLFAKPLRRIGLSP